MIPSGMVTCLQWWKPLVNPTFRSRDMTVLYQEVPFSLLMVSQLYNRASTKKHAGPQFWTFHRSGFSHTSKVYRSIRGVRFYVNLTVRGTCKGSLSPKASIAPNGLNIKASVGVIPFASKLLTGGKGTSPDPTAVNAERRFSNIQYMPYSEPTLWDKLPLNLRQVTSSPFFTRNLNA
jgi:hypothetical protein